MTGGFQVGPFQTNFQQEGIGLAEEGIGLAPAKPPIVDHVIESPYWMPRVVRPFGQVRPDLSSYKQEKAELQEMMRMYAQWRKAT